MPAACYDDAAHLTSLSLASAHRQVTETLTQQTTIIGGGRKLMQVRSRSLLAMRGPLVQTMLLPHLRQLTPLFVHLRRHQGGGGEATRVTAQVVFPQGQVADPPRQARRLQTALRDNPQAVFSSVPQFTGRRVRTERADNPFQTQARACIRVRVRACRCCRELLRGCTHGWP
jgi:hypothetical protein